MKYAAQRDIRVLQPVAIAHDATSMLVPFLEAEPLDEYLQQGQVLAYLQGYLKKNRDTFSPGNDLVAVQVFIRTHLQLFGVWKTVVIDTVHESTILPVSEEC